MQFDISCFGSWGVVATATSASNAQLVLYGLQSLLTPDSRLPMRSWCTPHGENSPVWHADNDVEMKALLDWEIEHQEVQPTDITSTEHIVSLLMRVSRLLIIAGIAGTHNAISRLNEEDLELLDNLSAVVNALAKKPEILGRLDICVTQAGLLPGDTITLLDLVDEHLLQLQQHFPLSGVELILAENRDQGTFGDLG